MNFLGHNKFVKIPIVKCYRRFLFFFRVIIHSDSVRSVKSRQFESFQGFVSVPGSVFNSYLAGNFNVRLFLLIISNFSKRHKVFETVLMDIFKSIYNSCSPFCFSQNQLYRHQELQNVERNRRKKIFLIKLRTGLCCW